MAEVQAFQKKENTCTRVHKIPTAEHLPSGSRSFHLLVPCTYYLIMFAKPLFFVPVLRSSSARLRRRDTAAPS